MLNYLTLVYYARIGARAVLSQCGDAITKALDEHDDYAFDWANREMVRAQRDVDAFDEIWKGLTVENAAQKSVFWPENRET